MGYTFNRYKLGGQSLLPGSLLVAHPSLQESPFRRSVVLLVANSDSDGSMGVVINQSLESTLGVEELDRMQSPLSEVPLYTGGPVAKRQLLLVAWRWEPNVGVFQLLFGIDTAKASELLAAENGFKVRAYLGYSGWSQGQLQAELNAGAWLPMQLTPEIDSLDTPQLWRYLLATKGAHLQLASLEPDNPALN